MIKDIISLLNFNMNPYLNQLIIETDNQYKLGAKIENSLILLNEYYENVKKFYLVDYSKFIYYYWQNPFDFDIQKYENSFIFKSNDILFEFPIQYEFDKNYFITFKSLDLKNVLNSKFLYCMLYFYNRYYLNPISYIYVYDYDKFYLYFNDLVFLNVKVNVNFTNEFFVLNYYLISYFLVYVLCYEYPKNKNIFIQYKRKLLNFDKQIFLYNNLNNDYFFRFNNYTNIYYKNNINSNIQIPNENFNLIALIDFDDFKNFLKQNITKKRTKYYLKLILNQNGIFLVLDLLKYRLEKKINGKVFQYFEILLNYEIALLFFNIETNLLNVFISNSYLKFNYEYKNNYHYTIDLYVKL